MVLPDDEDEVMVLPQPLPQSDSPAEDLDVEFVWPDDDTGEDNSIDEKFDKIDQIADFDDADMNRIHEILDSINIEPRFL